MAQSLPETSRLLHLFNYIDGKLYWRKGGRGRKRNLRAGCIKGGSHPYRVVRVDGVLYKEHRLIWKMWYSYDPHVIDHIDGNSLNNTIGNLRDVDYKINSANNKADCVELNHGKSYIARVKLGGERKYLGTFSSYDEAKWAASAERKLYIEQNTHT